MHAIFVYIHLRIGVANNLFYGKLFALSAVRLRVDHLVWP